MSPAVAFRRTRLNHNSLASIAGALARAGLPSGFRVSLVDRKSRLPGDARIAAFSFCTPELQEVSDEIRTIRASRKNRVLLVAGGPHPSADPQGALEAGFDVVCVGEGEVTFPKLVNQVAAGKQPDSGTVLVNQSVIDLDQRLHVVPEYGLFPFAEISRGCGHACGFCQVSPLFGRMRHRSPDVVARGVESAIRAGFKRIRYLTPDAFAYAGGAEGLSALFEAVRRAGASQQMLGNFPSEVRPDHVNAELLELVRRHCFNRTIVIGLQSGSDRVLKSMKRGHGVAQAREAVAKIHEAGFTPHVDILLCFPGETTQERQQTVELAEWCIGHAGARIHAHVYLPLPGTRAWPAPAEPLERSIASSLRKLRAGGRLDGDWENQASCGRQIMQWRNEGKILV